MKLITRDTDYAVRALAFIAKSGEKVVPAAEMFRKLRIPRPFLRKILQVLNQKGILRSFKGRGGGFSLAVPAAKIYLADLMEVFQGPLSINECFFKKMLCPERKCCPLRGKIVKIEKYVISQLKDINLASLLKE